MREYFCSTGLVSVQAAAAAGEIAVATRRTAVTTATIAARTLARTPTAPPVLAWRAATRGRRLRPRPGCAAPDGAAQSRTSCRRGTAGPWSARDVDDGLHDLGPRQQDGVVVVGAGHLDDPLQTGRGVGDRP